MRWLFGTAVVGVAVVVGIALSALGPVVLAFYLALLAYGATKLVQRVRAESLPAGRTCTCCTSTVHDPVEVR